MSKSLILLWIFVCLISAFGGEDENETRGEKLPSFVNEALEKSRAEFSWTNPFTKEKLTGKIRIDSENVVLISDMSEFCKVRRISKSDCKKFGESFVLEYKFPIFLNGDEKARSSFPWADETYRNNALGKNLPYYLAGVLIHEHSHATGEKSELAAYLRELGFIRSAMAKGELNEEFWLPKYLINVQDKVIGSFIVDERLIIQAAIDK